MVKSFSTPANSPTVSFNANLYSPIVAFSSGTPDPQSVTGPIRFSNPRIEYGGQIKVH